MLSHGLRMLSLQCLLLAVSSERANSACDDDFLAGSYTLSHSFPHTCPYTSQGLPSTTLYHGLPTTTPTNNNHCRHT